MAKSFPNTGATVIDSVSDLPAASADLEGVMVFQKDTNELKICDGSSWVSVVDTDTPNGLVHIETKTLTGSSVSFDNVFSTTFNVFQIKIAYAQSSAGYLGFRLRAGGVDSTTNYSGINVIGYHNGTSGIVEWEGTATVTNAAYVTYNGGGGTERTGATWDVFLPSESVRTMISGTYSRNYAGTKSITGITGVTHTLNTAYDGFTLFPVTGGGTFSSGTASVYGYRK
jgi:hypothetical protein